MVAIYKDGVVVYFDNRAWIAFFAVFGKFDGHADFRLFVQRKRLDRDFKEQRFIDGAERLPRLQDDFPCLACLHMRKLAFQFGKQFAAAQFYKWRLLGRNADCLQKVSVLVVADV